MQHKKRYDLTIVGAGLSGLTLAHTVSQYGLKVCLIDKTDPRKFLNQNFDGRTTALSHSSKTLLDQIGIWKNIENNIGTMSDIRITDGPYNDKTSLFYIHFSEEDNRHHPLGYIVENRILRKILLDFVLQSNQIDIISGQEIIGLEKQADSNIAILEDGLKISSDLIVSAEGKFSFLRDFLKINTVDLNYQQSALVCTIQHEHSHQNIAYEKFLPSGPFAILPMQGGHHSSIVWTEKTKHADQIKKMGNREFLKNLRLKVGDFLGEINLVEPRGCYPLSLKHAERYIDHRFCLIGDAAHAIHPIAGQGFNLGIRDIAVLAELLIDQRRLGLDIGNSSILKQYQQMRMFDNMSLVASTDLLTRLFSNESQSLRFIRNIGMGVIHKMPGLRNFCMQFGTGNKGELPKLLRGESL